jgi:hypothetical protein
MANPTLGLIQVLLWSKGIRVGKLSGADRYMLGMMGTPDKVPFPGAQMHDHSMHVARVPARKYYWDANLLVSVQMAVQRWYGMDGYTVISDAYNTEIEALGAKFIYSDIAMPTPDVAHPLISSPADLAKMKPLDPSKARCPMMVEVARLVRQKAPGLLQAGVFCSPVSMLCGLMGYPAAVRALRKTPDFARDLFAYMENDVIMPFIEAQAKGSGSKQFFGPDAWAAFPNLTIEMLREWVVPSAKRLAAKGKERKWTIGAGLVAADYCEEDPAKFEKQIMWQCFDVMCELGLLGMKMVLGAMGRTQDWDPNWVQEYALTHGDKGAKLPISMALNGRFLRDSKPEEIIAKVRQWIDVLGREGKFSLSTANIPADTNPLNVFTAAAAVHQLGTYPIAKDLSKVEVKVPRFQPFEEWLKGQPEEEVIRKAREK